ncbi:MAG TPA: RNA-binding domain-containing protein [Bacteroidota bacterium]|nr:RNA-binding domain-containing protein [Bacteroidota bacterium]
MTLHDVKLMVEEGEGFELEFKRKVSSPQKIARTLIAFANTRGGIMLFGVDDDGTLVGVESEKEELDLIFRAGEFYCDPPVIPEIEIVPYKHRDVIVAIIAESDDKPHALVNDETDESKIFIRVNDKTVPASKEVIKVLRDERADRPPLTLTIGENERRLFEYLEKHERVTVDEYADAINVSKRRASRILTTLVRAGVIRIHTIEKSDFFTLAADEIPTTSAQHPKHKPQHPHR